MRTVKLSYIIVRDVTFIEVYHTIFVSSTSTEDKSKQN